MRRSRRKSPTRTASLALLTAAALAALGLQAGTAVAQPDRTANGSERTTASERTAPPQARDVAQRERVASYWTAERMRAAVPVEKLAPPPAHGERTAVAAGRPGRVAPVAPTRDAAPAAFPQPGGAWTGGGDVVKTSGRVFFTFDGRSASCSGNAVTSKNGSTVLTAGHCVKYQGSWHTDWVFVPGYHDGQAPYGKWSASKTLTTPQWEASENINYDVGAAVVAPLDGRKLTDVVGGQGLAFNGAYNQNMYAFGFPAADPYDGEKLIYCAAKTIKDPLFSTDHGMACDMTGGSSGGPWFSKFDESTGRGLQASVNSFGYVFLPNTMFGPYFGNDAKALYDKAQAS